jgi:hypothetical protein
MSQPSAPPPPAEWTPPVPTEGPLAGSSGAAPVVPVMASGTTAVPRKKSNKFAPIIIGLAILFGLGVAAKMTVLKSDVAPGAEEVEAAFAPVSGFTYAELPDEAVEQAQSFIDGNEQASEAISSFEIRQVNQGGAQVGAVIIFGVDPEVMGDAFRSGFASGFQGSAGVELQESTVSGTEVLSVTLPVGSGTMFFDEGDGLIFFVQGNDQTVADELTKGLIKANL